MNEPAQPTATSRVNAEKPSFLQRYGRLIPRLLARRVDHSEVVEHVYQEGRLTPRFLFMTAMSCAIAMLGLLLSSPAVVIGAMLVSPLMGPIMLLGFSLTTRDFDALRISAVTLLCGVLVALAISMLIVICSPIREATPEILARTRPNLFDLLVALFSALAGGYAVINRKGEAITGVAIATALMPPLAVAGYGIAEMAWSLAGGALFLFMTNLLAIALTVSLMTMLYRFRSRHGHDSTFLQTILIFCVFAALSVPLGLSLQKISNEAHVAAVVREEMLLPFGGGPDARISDLSVAFGEEGRVNVSATVLTRSRMRGAGEQVKQALSARLNRPFELKLDQVLVGSDETLESRIMEIADSSLAAPLRDEISSLKDLASQQSEQSEKLKTLDELENNMRKAAPVALRAADINTTEKTAKYFASEENRLSVAAYRTIETKLRASYPDWRIDLIPPVIELPLIAFGEGEELPRADTDELMIDCVWALNRWEVSQVETVGYASTAGAAQNFNNSQLAFRRAQYVAELLRGEGFDVEPVGEYRAVNQVELERRFGRERFQKVLIRPAAF